MTTGLRRDVDVTAPLPSPETIDRRRDEEIAGAGATSDIVEPGDHCR
ncbi:hypothetical protein OHB01_21695 [Microbispora hainanensis]|uniref:Uncharacterized protein n=1 Tax=Microbispora hainanensis TaxID=568844 RepID=A0ABZ1SSL9_9ACTN|nr:MULTISPECIES: hypothetical protein [Microbispora]NJP30300.1 hypothetical protein [Microbispora sp. CL1-1]